MDFRFPDRYGLWYYQEVEPSSAHTVRTGALAELGVKAWTFDADSELQAGADLARLVTAQAERLSPCLDRSAVRQAVVARGADAFADVIIAVVDEGPSALLEECLDRAERHTIREYSELAAWARARLRGDESF